MKFAFLWDDVPEDRDYEKLKELCTLMVEEAARQDDLLSCPHTWLYDDERDTDGRRVLDTD